MSNTRISALTLSGNDLLAGVTGAGPLSGVHVSHDRGRTFEDFRPLPNVLDFGVHLGRLYAATEKGLFERRGADWFRLKELGENRVEQIVVDGERIAVRTLDGLWDLQGGKFVQRPFKHGPPRSAAFFGDALWVTDAQGVYRLTADANHTVPAPFPGGRLQRLEEQLLLWGPGGTFTKTSADADWTELTHESSRLLATGDERFPALLISGDTVRLFDREARKFQALDVPIPARDIAAARVIDGRLLLGTSGYGVMVRDVPAAAPVEAQTTR
jgi:hypothetical protein